MLVLEKQYSPNAEELNFFKYITSNNFPWYYNETEIEEAAVKYPFFSHVIVNRPVGDVPVMGAVNSEFFPLLLNIFNKFCYENNIKYKNICRMALNFNFHQNDRHTNIHVDHNFDHKNFIMYLSECSGDTIIFDDQDQIIASVKPKLYKGIVFDGLKHAAGFCKPNEHRIVLVITFAAVGVVGNTDR
jgi:hypothetical protein